MRTWILALLVLTACGKVIDDDDDVPAAQADPTRVGAACKVDADCVDAKGNGAGLTCSLSAYGLPLANGYCTRKCSAVSECPGSEGEVACVTVLDAGTPGGRDVCLRRCQSGVAETGCRSGYVCQSRFAGDAPASDVTSCWVSPF